MASRAISGKPGAGKSLFAVEELVVGELMGNTRFIVTNIPLRRSNVIKYLAEHGRDDISFDERVLLIGNDNMRMSGARHDDEALRSFWRFRGPELILPDISDDAIKAGERPPMESFGQTGVHYFLDEWHEFCNSRQWAKTGPMLLWYIAKHRHFGDDVTWITQHVPNVDKQWRSVTQAYLYCRNFTHEKFRGFNKGAFISVTTYLEMFTGTQTAQEVKKFKLDKKGIGSCYYTSLANTKADTEKPRKGLSIRWVYAAIGMVALLLYLFFTGGINWIFGKIGGGVQPKPKNVSGEYHNRPAPVGSGNPAPNVIFNAEQQILNVVEKPWHVVSVPLSETTAHQAIESIKADGVVLPNIFVSSNAANNALILTGDDLQKLTVYSELCRKYDVESRLITVNCVVGRLVRGKGSKVGLYDLMQQSANREDGPLSELLVSAVYDFSTGIMTFGASIAAREFLRVITDFQATNGKFEVVSRPTLTVIAGQSGEFRSGREIPIASTSVNNVAAQTSIQYKQAEFSFVVTPTLRPDGWVRLSIDQINSDVLSTTEIDGSPVPTLSTQKLKTLIDLNPLQVAYLGGIHIRTSRKDRRGVPILRDIPGVNLVFGTTDVAEETSELVVLVSVDVHARSETPVRVLKALPVSRHSKRDSWAIDTATISGAATSGSPPGGSTTAKNQRKKK